jgi:hypothetical protein
MSVVRARGAVTAVFFSTFSAAVLLVMNDFSPSKDCFLPSR